MSDVRYRGSMSSNEAFQSPSSASSLPPPAPSNVLDMLKAFSRKPKPEKAISNEDENDKNSSYFQASDEDEEDEEEQTTEVQHEDEQSDVVIINNEDVPHLKKTTLTSNKPRTRASKKKPSTAENVPRPAFNRQGTSMTRSFLTSDLLRAHATTLSTTNSRTDLPSIILDPFVFLPVFVATIFPFLGLRWYKKYVVGADAGLPAVDLHNKDKNEEDTKKEKEKEKEKEKADKPAVVTSTPATATAPVAVIATAAGGVKETETHFDWTILSGISAIRSAYAFQLPDFFASGESWGETARAIIRVLRDDEKYIMNPHFYGVFQFFSLSLFGFMFLFSFLEDATFTLRDSLFYSFRFYVCTAALISAIFATKTEGGKKQYKKLLNDRAKLLQNTSTKIVLFPNNAPPSADASSSSQSSPSLTSFTTNLVSNTAYDVYIQLDRASKSSKSHKLERRIVYILSMSLLRGILAYHSSTSQYCFLYGLFHLLLGFLFFAVISLFEFELHDDERRWRYFNTLHSESLAKKRGLNFYLPLLQFPNTENILAWFEIRKLFKDFKGKYDFVRLQIVLICAVFQLLSVCGFSLYWSYFMQGHSVTEVYEHVLGQNLLVAFDTFMILLVILDFIAAGVSINRLCSTHATMLLDEELTRCFALSQAASDSTDESELFLTQLITDSIQQIRTLREKLTHIRESEKLSIFGFRLDDSLFGMVRATLVSYAVVFGQSLFTRGTPAKK